MNAQKISDLKAEHMGSLWDFLQRLPNSMEAQILYGLIIAGLVGLCASWLWKFSNKQVGCFTKYLFTEEWVRSLASVLGMTGTAVIAVMAGVFETESGEFVGWLNVLWWGAQSGFGIDLAVNRGAAKPK